MEVTFSGHRGQDSSVRCSGTHGQLLMGSRRPCLVRDALAWHVRHIFPALFPMAFIYEADQS